MAKKRESNIRIDQTTDAVLLNRYLAFVSWKRYNTKGSLKENVVIAEGNYYHVQWKNIKADIKGLFKNPMPLLKPVALSLAAFIFIALRRHEEAIYTSFFMGSIGFDAAAQSSVSGEPASITWNHTVGSSANRFIALMKNGLATPNNPKLDSQPLTTIIEVGTSGAYYFLNPAAGTRVCFIDGGNIKVGASVSFTGVNQNSVIGATNSESGSASPNAMPLTTVNNNSFRVDVLAAEKDNGTSPTGTLDNGTLRCNPSTPSNQFRDNLYVYTNQVVTAGLTTYNWTTDAFNRYYIAFEVNEAPAGASTSASISPSPSISPSASVSPSSSSSASRSPSSSVSASVSPSSSTSASVSPSASTSPSSSISSSISPSASVSPSSSRSPSSSVSASTSPSSSRSPSASASPSASIPLTMMGIGQ